MSAGEPLEVPLFGRVAKAAVMARFGRLMADERCTCVECFDAGCEGPPVLEPAGVDVVPDLAGTGERHVAMGVWRHGRKLRDHEIERAKFNEAIARVVERLKAPGGDQ